MSKPRDLNECQPCKLYRLSEYHVIDWYLTTDMGQPDIVTCARSSGSSSLGSIFSTQLQQGMTSVCDLAAVSLNSLIDLTLLYYI